jgi:N-acetylneuraminic acid mutarotase
MVLLICFIIYNARSEDLYYSGVARNSSGSILSEQYVSIKIKIAPNNDMSNPIFVETHTVYTNEFGAYSLLIGKGTNVSGSLNSINVATNTYLMQVEIDYSAPFSSYTLIETKDFLTVAKQSYGEANSSTPSGALKAFNTLEDRPGWTYTGISEVLGTPDTWTAMSTTGAPANGRGNLPGVWTGDVLIIWGGRIGREPDVFTADGAIYNPLTDNWTSISSTNAPSARGYHTAIWTGSEMIVWGGYGSSSILNDGKKYNPTTDTWTTISSTNAPSARYSHSAKWTGSEMIIWGGRDTENSFNDGAKYNPSTDTWTSITTSNAPSARYLHASEWTGSKMLVWGGKNTSADFNSGGIYDPSANSWTSITTTNAPIARFYLTSVWTGDKMIIWGGYSISNGYLNDGSYYNPTTNSWSALSSSGLETRANHSAIWTGSEMVIFGGTFGGAYVNGARYNIANNSWTTLPSTNSPALRDMQIGIWTGSQMIVWGGRIGDNTFTNTGSKLGTALSIYWYKKD